MDLPPPSYEEAVRQGPGNDHSYSQSQSHRQGRLSLELQGESIRDLSTGRVLYKLSRPVTTLPKPGPSSSSSSVIFERVEHGNGNTTPGAESVEDPKKEAHAHVRSEKELVSQKEDQSQSQNQNKHLFYLVHPAGAQYRTDIPAYYITCLNADPTKMQGNMQFETRGTTMHGTEFSAMLSRGRTWEHKPLFAVRGNALLFTARREGLMGGRYTWREHFGREAGREGAEIGERRRLVITSPMAQEKMDALVALWALRVWYEVAESPKAKREGESLP